MSQPSIVIRTTSREETAALGARLAPFLAARDVVILSGDLGAGKTALSRGLIGALGSEDPVTSPTFTIMRHHPLPAGGQVEGQVLHLDAYRLHGPADAEDIGLLELLDAGAIAVIEWGERISSALGADQLVITLIRIDGVTTREDEDVRMIEIRGAGPRWDAVNFAALELAGPLR
jgi:tRNA threonylcarbamoyladenosine biosynthesis protein TsaE